MARDTNAESRLFDFEPISFLLVLKADKLCLYVLSGAYLRTENQISFHPRQ